MIRLDEGRIPLLCFIATVPASDEIYTSGEEARLGDTQQEPQDAQLGEGLHPGEQHRHDAERRCLRPGDVRRDRHRP